MKTKIRRRRGGPRRHRARTTPRWLAKSEEIDRVAQARCLLVLSVLSGEKPVTDAIAESGVSRAAYYQMETRALQGMLRALGPAAAAEELETNPARRIAQLEEKVRTLERSRRRNERLLLMTRRVLQGRATRTGSTDRGSGRSRSSRTRASQRRKPSTPTPTGAPEA
jgi:hypothetical protein